MQDDIVNKITDYAGSDEIDQFHLDMKRREALSDRTINDILAKVFAGIDTDRLTGDTLAQWNDINQRL
jgi:hypothetical protein